MPKLRGVDLHVSLPVDGVGVMAARTVALHGHLHAHPDPSLDRAERAFASATAVGQCQVREFDGAQEAWDCAKARRHWQGWVGLHHANTCPGTSPRGPRHRKSASHRVL